MRALVVTVLAILATSCGTDIRNGNGLIGNRAAKPACFIETDTGGRFVDKRDPQCRAPGKGVT